MRIIGCDLHAREQTIAMLDTHAGEWEEKALEHEGEKVREFYASLPAPVLVGIEAWSAGALDWQHEGAGSLEPSSFVLGKIHDNIRWRRKT